MTFLVLVGVFFFVFKLTEGGENYRLLGKCIGKLDGTPCTGNGGQVDGMCALVPTASNIRTLMCVSPKKQYFQFTVAARYYPETRKIQGTSPVKKLFMRGSGPGLSWVESVEMRKSATALNTWTADIQYQSSSEGLSCKSLSHCSLNQRALEFRIYKDMLAEEDMLGPNFYLPLPLSNSLKGSGLFLKPRVTVYPWFNSKQSYIKPLEYSFHSDFLGEEVKLLATIVCPPSFRENILKTYPLVILLENGKHYIPQFEYLSVHTGIVEESVVLIVDPDTLLKNTRKGNYSILPYDSFSMRCKSNDCKKCQVCWDSNRAEPCDKDEFIFRSKRCLYLKYSRGTGKVLLTDIILTLISKANAETDNRIRFDPPRERITLIGHGEQAVAAFVLGLSRPDLIVNVAALSPKFYLPMTSVMYGVETNVLDQMDDLALKFVDNSAQQILYLSQKYYIGHGEKDDMYFPLVNSVGITEEVIAKMKLKFRMEEGTNIMFQVTPNETLADADPNLAILSHIKPLLMYFHKAQGGTSKSGALNINHFKNYLASKGKQLLPEDFPGATTPPVNDSMIEINYRSGLDGDIEIFHCGLLLSQEEVPLTVFLGLIGNHNALS